MSEAAMSATSESFVGSPEPATGPVELPQTEPTDETADGVTPKEIIAEPEEEPIQESTDTLEPGEEPVQEPTTQSATARKERRKGLPYATLEQKVRVIDWHIRHGTKSQSFTVKYFQSLNEFSITGSALSYWLKRKVQLRSDLARTTHLTTAKFKRRSYVKYAVVDHCVSRQYEQWLHDHKKFTHHDLKDEWHLFKKLLYPEDDFQEDLEKTDGWLKYFRKKMALKRSVINEHQQYLIGNSRDDLELEIKRIRNATNGFKPCDVFHFDEFAVTTRILPTEDIFQKFIIGLGVNSDVSEHLPPLIISSDRALEELDNYYQSNSNNMTVDIFHKYLVKWNKHISINTPNRKVLILLDRLHEHVIKFDDFYHIKICWFNSNFQTKYSDLDCTYNKKLFFGNEIQPLNLGIIKNFKLHFKANLMKHYINTVQLAKYLFENEDDVSIEVPTLKISNDLVYELIVDSYEYIKSPGFQPYSIKCWQVSNLLREFEFDARKGHDCFNQVHDEQLELNYYKFIKTLDRCGYLIQKPDFTLDQLMFPEDERVVNKYLTRMEIVALVKLETQYIQRPYQLDEKQDVDDDDEKEDNEISRATVISQLESLDPLLSTQVKFFFEENSKNFPKSAKLFQKFLNSYIIESIDYQFTNPPASK